MAKLMSAVSRLREHFAKKRGARQIAGRLETESDSQGTGVRAIVPR